VPEAAFRVLLVCPGGGPDFVECGASYRGERLPHAGDEIEVVRSDGRRARALVRIVEAAEDPPITLRCSN